MFTPDGKRHEPIPVKADDAMFTFHKQLIALRKKRPDWVRGSLKYVLADDDAMTLAYRREKGKHRSVVVFNFSNEPRTIQLKNGRIIGATVLATSYPDAVKNVATKESTLKIDLAPVSGAAVSLK